MARVYDAQTLQGIVDSIAERMVGEVERGVVANYIPELATVNLNQFGIAIVLANGEVICAGDAEVPFSIQSISKVLTLTLALERCGATLWQRVGREPSGDPFNSIIQLEYEKGVPRNPFINAGAIVTADVVLEGQKPDQAVDQILDLCRRAAGDDDIFVDQNVAKSEAQTGHRNRALAQFISAENNLRCTVEDTLSVYFRQCSIAMSCRQLAHLGRYLALGGQLAETDDAIITQERTRRILALMMTCGAYDASGDFAFRIGIPAKTGVGGGILGIVPGVASVAAWCPGLDNKGNSLLATRALDDLVRQAGWSLFTGDVHFSLEE
ncbi:glutaminase [Falsihalocynthiibacter sp. SS001]|uniref:glutaminase n=1 Tax=Falsihalocynthiibacter sp. SS001 TaxID=3349698 RepID=UPI0036D38E65